MTPKAKANQPYADQIRAARRQSGLTLGEFALALAVAGVPATGNQVWKWERGLVTVPAYVVPAAQRVVLSAAERVG